MEIITIAYDQTYTKIGPTIVYSTGPGWQFGPCVDIFLKAFHG